MEALARGRILRNFVGEKLERDSPPETQILRLVHDAHSAAAEFMCDSIVGDGLAQHRAACTLRWRPMLGLGGVAVNENWGRAMEAGKIPAPLQMDSNLSRI